MLVRGLKSPRGLDLSEEEYVWRGTYLSIGDPIAAEADLTKITRAFQLLADTILRNVLEIRQRQSTRHTLSDKDEVEPALPPPHHSPPETKI